MKIEIVNQQKKIPLQPAQIKRIIKTILELLGVKTARLSFVFVTDRKIRVLNREFLNRNHTTDVLAFDLSQEMLSRIQKRSRIRDIEGEIVISTVTATKNAKLYKTTPYREVILYMIHGVLHLMGFDDHSAGDWRVMRDKEQKMLTQLRAQYDL